MNARFSTTSALLTDMATTGFLSGVPDTDYRKLVSLGRLQSFDIDEVIIAQGHPQQSLHLVLAGSLRVRCDSPYSVVELGLLVTGDCFGEMSVLDPLKASATVKTIEPGCLWVIDREPFRQFVAEHPRSGLALLTYLGIRLIRHVRKSDDRLLRNAARPVGFDYDY